MDISKLTVGQAYFMVTYPEPEMTKPIVITYEYLGTQEYDDGEGNIVSGHVFKYHPAFTYDDEMREFEKYPIAFSEKQISSLCNLKEMINELIEVEKRG